MFDLSTTFPRRYRLQMRVYLQFGSWRYSYELVGAKGGLHLHVTGPHNYDGADHWSAGLEAHSRTPLHEVEAPSHDECWLLKCPCWHDGTSLYAQEAYLPLVLGGAHESVFRRLVRDADERWGAKETMTDG